jgi:hypothetical protein
MASWEFPSLISFNMVYDGFMWFNMVEYGLIILISFSYPSWAIPQLILWIEIDKIIEVNMLFVPWLSI